MGSGTFTQLLTASRTLSKRASQRQASDSKGNSSLLKTDQLYAGGGLEGQSNRPSTGAWGSAPEEERSGLLTLFTSLLHFSNTILALPESPVLYNLPTPKRARRGTKS